MFQVQATNTTITTATTTPLQCRCWVLEPLRTGILPPLRTMSGTPPGSGASRSAGTRSLQSLIHTFTSKHTHARAYVYIHKHPHDHARITHTDTHTRGIVWKPVGKSRGSFLCVCGGLELGRQSPCRRRLGLRRCQHHFGAHTRTQTHTHMQTHTHRHTPTDAHTHIRTRTRAYTYAQAYT